MAAEALALHSWPLLAVCFSVLFHSITYGTRRQERKPTEIIQLLPSGPRVQLPCGHSLVFGQLKES